MVRVGYVDGCQGVHIFGWAIEDGAPALLTVEVDGAVIGNCQCDRPRPEVTAATGHPENCGFVFRFPRSIGAGDKSIGVRFRDGSHLTNSPSPHHAARIARLGMGIDGASPGIELGALDAPFLRQADHLVRYVDHGTRVEIAEKYRLAAKAGDVDLDQIVSTDIVWAPGARLRDAAGGRLFSYALASQVIEHVADPIGWLAEIASVLAPGGRLNLAIPDKRRTFDRERPLSTAGELLEDHARRLQRPTIRHVIDHRIATTPLGNLPAGPDEFYRRIHRRALEWDAAERYTDVHCHVWTYESFIECWRVIEAIGLLPLTLDQAWEPIDGANEFIVSFVRTPLLSD
jgi:SAM-dependent methyltransferase